MNYYLKALLVLLATWNIQSVSGQVLYTNQHLATIKTTLNNCQLLGLGEEAHGYESINKAKAELSVLLNDSLHFKNIIFESSFVLGVIAYYSDSNIPHRARQSLYPFWTTAPVQKAYNLYTDREIGDNRMHIAGCDIQEDFRFTLFSQYLISSGMIARNIVALQHADSILNEHIGKNPRNKSALTTDEQQQLQRSYQMVEQEIQQAATDEVQLQLLHRCIVNRTWLSRYLGITSTQKRMAMRDSLMADNVKWLQDVIFKNEKTIVWSTDLHVKKSKDGHPSWMGEYLALFYKQAYAAISITHKKSAGGIAIEAGNGNTLFDVSIYLHQKEKVEDRYWITPVD